MTTATLLLRHFSKSSGWRKTHQGLNDLDQVGGFKNQIDTNQAIGKKVQASGKIYWHLKFIGTFLVLRRRILRRKEILRSAGQTSKKHAQKHGNLGWVL